MVDTDRDGILDLVSTTYSSGIYIFKGLGDNKFEPCKALTFKNDSLINYKHALYNMSPLFLDWDNDNDLDLAVTGFVFGDSITQKMVVYSNEGDDKNPLYNPEGTLITTKQEGKEISGFKTLALDWDEDGKFDLITSIDEPGGGVIWFKNIGTKAKPEFAEQQFLIKPPEIDKDEYYANYGKPTERANESTWPSSRWQTHLADYNSDGKMDILIGDSFSEVTEVRKLTEEEAAAKKKLEEKQDVLRKESQPVYEENAKLYKEASKKGIARKDVKVPDELKKKLADLRKESSKNRKELQKYSNTESKYFGRVWVFLQN